MYRDRISSTPGIRQPTLSSVGHNGYPNYNLVYATYDLKSRYEWMVSEVGDMQEMHACDHYVISRDHDQSVPLVYDAGAFVDANPWGTWTNFNKPTSWCMVNQSPSTYDLRYGDWDNPIKGLPVLYSVGPDGVKHVVDPPDLQNLIDDSLNAMLPGIRPNLSILNSLYELKDLRTLPETINRVERTVSVLDKALRANRALPLIKRIAKLGSEAKRLLRLALGAVSDVYLQKEFNLDPLVGDVMKTYSSIQNVKKQVDSLLRNEGKIQKRHFRRFLNQSYPAYKDESFSIDGSPLTVLGTNTTGRLTQYVDPLFCATLIYSYRLNGIERENALLRGLLDSLGVNLNPQIIWNAIPWSFVVDWFVDIGRFLRDNTMMRNIEPYTYIQAYCWSFKVKRLISTYISWIGSPHGNGCTRVPVTGLVEVAYKRAPMVPDIIRSLRVSGLSLKEFSLSAALLGSNNPSSFASTRTNR